MESLERGRWQSAHWEMCWCVCGEHGCILQRLYIFSLQCTFWKRPLWFSNWPYYTRGEEIGNYSVKLQQRCANFFIHSSSFENKKQKECARSSTTQKKKCKERRKIRRGKNTWKKYFKGFRVFTTNQQIHHPYLLPVISSLAAALQVFIGFFFLL